MTTDPGRVGDADRALVSDQAASRLDPSGFDPSRICGEYVDRAGRAWLCLQRKRFDQGDLIVCEGVKGNFLYTACDRATFSAWGWHRSDSDGSGEAGETGTGSTEGDSAAPQGDRP